MSLTISEVAGLQTSKYFNVAGMAILIFDYVITVEDEVQWVWGRSWDVTRCFFTISRYIPFIGTGMTAYVALRSASDPCGPSLAENIFHIIGIVAAEMLLIFRTYAFWGDKRVLYGLLAYGIATICAAVAINVTPVTLFPQAGGKGAPPGTCLLVSGGNSTLVYLLLLLFELVILTLTVYKRFDAYREMRTNLVRTIYRDGMVYVICVILVTFANVIVDSSFPFQFSNLLDIPQITLHSVLASRIMFNLRKTSCVNHKDAHSEDYLLGKWECNRPSHSATSESSPSPRSGSKGETSYIDMA